MNAAQLLVWLVALAWHLDGHRNPIPRPLGAATTIANVCAEEADPKRCAATLDTITSHEAGYHTGLTGDGGKSCGAYQTPCSRTPPDGLGQTRLALAILKQAEKACPDHPLWAYASGQCRSSPVALRYEAEVKRALETQ